MKNGLLILNVVLLAAVAVLFYLHFSTAKKTDIRTTTSAAGTRANSSFQIAYFDMDSIANTFSMVKDVKAELSKKEEALNNELTRMERDYRAKAAKYQEQAPNMNQTQSEMAQRDMMQTQQAMQGRKQQLEQEYQELELRKRSDIHTKIETYLKEYNRDNRFAYIISYEPELFYYKDTAYNITADLIKGLNAGYDKKK